MRKTGTHFDATRRNVLTAAGLAAPAMIGLSGCATSEQVPIATLQADKSNRVEFATPPDLIVDTDKGKVRGYLSGGIRTFKGIPYGADTSGKNRFRPPVAPAPWSEVRDAFAYGATCPQSPPGPADRMGFLLNHQVGHTSEDCLNLNVWTPGTDGGKRPVMVWIHGGNYSTGSSYAIASQDGESLARRGDVVIVSVNHRLNILGHFDLGALGAGADFSTSVNVGLLDLVRALEWVRDNIGQFGGDASNVTLFGQSGGGLKITHLSGMPSAKGLFHKAVVQSGSQVEVFAEDMTAEISSLALDELGVDVGNVKALQTLPISTLQAASQAATTEWRRTGGFGNIWRTVGWAPRIESGTLPFHPYSKGGAVVSRDIALMAGSTLHEFNLALFNPAMEAMTREELKSSLAAIYSDPEAVIVAAEQTYPDQKPVALYSIISAASFNRRNAIKQCQAKAALGGAPAFLYQFNWETPVLDGTPRAYHCAELHFVFANAMREIQATGGGDDARLVETQLCDAWTAFAHSGNPRHEALPAWTAVRPMTAPTMVFNSQAALENGRDQQLIEVVGQLTT